MKLLIVGSDKSKWSLGGLFQNAFLSLGCEVDVFPDEYIYWHRDAFFLNRYTHRLFWRLYSRHIQKELLKKVSEYKPDLILFLKGWYYSPSVLLDIRKQFPKTVLFNWNSDNPFNTWHHAMSNSWIRKSIPLFDVYMMWGRFMEQPLLNAGAQKFLYVPCGYDDSLHYPVSVTSEDKKEYGSDVAFIGTYDKEREYWLGFLKDYDLKIWGNSWEKCSDDELKKKWQGKSAEGEEFAKICASSKIVINIVRKQNGTAHNMRTFEVPACKGFMLSTRTPESVGFFPEDVAAGYFSTPQELCEKVSSYLAHNEKRDNARINAYNLLISRGDTYANRAKLIIDTYTSFL